MRITRVTSPEILYFALQLSSTCLLLEQWIQNKEEDARSSKKLSGEGRDPQVKCKMRLITG